MTYTQNYQLPQWVKSDRILMDDFNDANTKIDAALKSHDDSLASLETALTGGLAAKGNCQIYRTSYTGAGTYGETSPNTLTFPAAPVLVLICGGEVTMNGGNGKKAALAIRGGNLFVPHISNNINFWPTTWSADGKTMSWYAFNASAEGQLNAAGVTYTVVALLPAE